VTRFAVFLLAVFSAMTVAARADDQVLETQTHREVWHGYSDEVIKDFEWSVKPTISTQDGSLSVHVDENVTRHADGFAGVTGEMEFSNDAFQSIDVQFADGTTTNVQSGTANFTGDAAAKKITKITANFSLVGRTWSLSWDVNAGAGAAPAAANDNLPPDWTEATSTPPPASAPLDTTPQKGTWLTPTGIKDRPQDLEGIWRQSGDDVEAGQEMQWLHQAGNKLTGALLSDRLGGSSIRLTKAGDSNVWQGDGAPPGVDGTGFAICPAPKGTCPRLCRWAAGFLNIEPGALHIAGEWHDKRVDPDHCTFLDETQTQAENYDRFVGASFAPVLPGKYLYMGMAPAVGSQPAQFKALVRIATNYTGTGAAEVKTTVDPATATLARSGGDAGQAIYEFTTTGHGTFEICFNLADKTGAIFHTDRLRIEIPTVPGIGN